MKKLIGFSGMGILSIVLVLLSGCSLLGKGLPDFPPETVVYQWIDVQQHTLVQPTGQTWADLESLIEDGADVRLLDEEYGLYEVTLTLGENPDPTVTEPLQRTVFIQHIFDSGGANTVLDGDTNSVLPQANQAGVRVPFNWVISIIVVLFVLIGMSATWEYNKSSSLKEVQWTRVLLFAFVLWVGTLPTMVSTLPPATVNLIDSRLIRGWGYLVTVLLWWTPLAWRFIYRRYISYSDPRRWKITVETVTKDNLSVFITLAIPFNPAFLGDPAAVFRQHSGLTEQAKVRTAFAKVEEAAQSVVARIIARTPALRFSEFVYHTNTLTFWTTQISHILINNGLMMMGDIEVISIGYAKDVRDELTRIALADTESQAQVKSLARYNNGSPVSPEQAMGLLQAIGINQLPGAIGSAIASLGGRLVGGNGSNNTYVPEETGPIDEV